MDSDAPTPFDVLLETPAHDVQMFVACLQGQLREIWGVGEVMTADVNEMGIGMFHFPDFRSLDEIFASLP